MILSPVHQDTEVVLREVLKRKPGTVLEIGCATGYLSIELAKRGWNVTGTDIIPKAIEVSRSNAEQADVSVTFIESDLFDKVKRRFDVIIFNPPVIFSTNRLYPYARSLVARIPPLNNVLERLISYLPNAQHSALMERFFKNVKGHLTSDGVIYLVFFDSQLQRLRKNFTTFKTLEAGPTCKLIIIAREHLQSL